MSWKQGMIDMAIVLSIFATLGWVIMARVVKDNPKAAKFMKKFSISNWYDKPEENNSILNKKSYQDAPMM